MTGMSSPAARTIAQAIRCVNESFLPAPLSWARRSASSPTDSVRKLVAVGIDRLMSMNRASVAAGPRITVVSAPSGTGARRRGRLGGGAVAAARRRRSARRPWSRARAGPCRSAWRCPRPGRRRSGPRRGWRWSRRCRSGWACPGWRGRRPRAWPRSSRPAGTTLPAGGAGAGLDAAQHRAHGHGLVGLGQQLDHGAGHRGGQRGVDLVGGHLGQVVALGDLVAHLDQPLQQRALDHGVAHLGQGHVHDLARAARRRRRRRRAVRVSGSAAAGASPASISHRAWPTVTVSSTSTSSLVTTPATVEGTGASTLSVDISTRSSPSATVSPDLDQPFENDAFVHRLPDGRHLDLNSGSLGGHVLLGPLYRWVAATAIRVTRAHERVIAHDRRSLPRRTPPAQGAGPGRQGPSGGLAAAPAAALAGGPARQRVGGGRGRRRGAVRHRDGPARGARAAGAGAGPGRPEAGARAAAGVHPRPLRPLRAGRADHRRLRLRAVDAPQRRAHAQAGRGPRRADEPPAGGGAAQRRAAGVGGGRARGAHRHRQRGDAAGRARQAPAARGRGADRPGPVAGPRDAGARAVARDPAPARAAG